MDASYMLVLFESKSEDSQFYDRIFVLESFAFFVMENGTSISHLVWNSNRTH